MVSFSANSPFVELGGSCFPLGLEGLHPPGQLLLAGQQAPMGILAAQPLRRFLFQPGGTGKSAVRAGGTVMRSTAYWGLRV